MPSTTGIVASGVVQWDLAWRAAYTAQAAGGGQAHVVVLGDSLTQGFEATTNFYERGFVGVLTAELAARTGVTAGTGLIPTSDETYPIPDDRTAPTGSFSTSTTSGGFFTRQYIGASGATWTLGPVTCSAFRVTYMTLSAGGAWTATVDAGTPANYTSNGSDDIVVVDIDAGGSGSHTLTLTAVGAMYIVGVEVIRNPTSGVKVSRIGYTGKKASDLVADASGNSSRQAYLTLDPDLAIIEFGLNEAITAASTSTFRTSLETLVDDMKSLGASVLLVVAPDPDPAVVTAGYNANYASVIRSVAYAKNCGLVDFYAIWGAYPARSYLYQDYVHPDRGGHLDLGRRLAEVLVPTTVPADFTPDDLGDLAFWLDSSDASTFTYSSGSTVSQWNDKSGNTRHVIQSTDANRPVRSGTINSLSTVTFDGSNDSMLFYPASDLITVGPWTAFAVVKPTSVAAGQGMILDADNTPRLAQFLRRDAATAQSIGFNTVPTAFSDNGGGSLVSGTAHQVAGRLDATSQETWLDGWTDGLTAASGTLRTNAGSLTTLTVGASSSGSRWTGDIAEVILYNKALTTVERLKVESYLRAKWGTA